MSSSGTATAASSSGPDLLACLGELRGWALGCGDSRAVAGRRAHRRAEASHDVASPARPPNPAVEIRIAVLPETPVLDMGTFRHDGPSRRLGGLDTRVASSRLAALLGAMDGPRGSGGNDGFWKEGAGTVPAALPACRGAGPPGVRARGPMTIHLTLSSHAHQIAGVRQRSPFCWGVGLLRAGSPEPAARR
jgi:hypothetical protein